MAARGDSAAQLGRGMMDHLRQTIARQFVDNVARWEMAAGADREQHLQRAQELIRAVEQAGFRIVRK